MFSHLAILQALLTTLNGLAHSSCALGTKPHQVPESLHHRWRGPHKKHKKKIRKIGLWVSDNSNGNH